MSFKYDFAGWATKYDIKCTDGRTIRHGAFSGCNGRLVPLVFQHNHNDISNVLGKVLLEGRPEGMYAYGSFNSSDKAESAREAVAHGDITALSIFANRLNERDGNVYHGDIKEVSLVLAGANEGAVIEYPIIEHSDGSWETDWGASEAVIQMSSISEWLDNAGELTDDEVNVIMHADNKDDDDDDNDDKESAPSKSSSKRRSVSEIIESLSEEDQETMYLALDYLADHGSEIKKGIAGSNNNKSEGDSVEHFDEGGNMKYNVFEGINEAEGTLSHADYLTLQEKTINDAKKNRGSMKEAFLAHAAEYGIESIDYLFPDAKNINGTTPEFLNYDQEWVSVVMNGIHHSPFSRIKSTYADITEDEARAKGYMKGNRKTEEVFGMLRRTTTPCTIYKKQKMDRDDIIDITDFDVVAWLKTEMRLKLNEEIARAILFSDGRSTLSQDKISEEHIRPIIKEDDLFCIKYTVAAGADADETAKNVIRAAVKSRKGYRGTGNPIMFMGEDLLSDMLLLEDRDGHDLYESQQKLETKMRVSRIVTVPDEVLPEDMYALIVNLADYTVGADKGGSINMFEDFDIDYNQEKYLMETRCSGCLTKPYSAVVLKKNA